MASGFSASTTKLSGTKKMGTSPTVMTARQNGKSMFGNWVDAWDTIDNSKAERPVTYLEFNSNLLALICAMLRNGKQAYEAAEVLNGLGRATRPLDASRNIENQDVDRANTILKYFAQKHTLRRVKGEWVSDYMLAIDDIVDNPCRINQEHVGILVSLPRIYEQNRALERVMKPYNSAPKREKLSFPPMEAELTFVESVRVKQGQHKQIHYFWSTPNNYLVRIVLKADEYGINAWDTLARHGKIKLSTENSYTYAIRGYDFNVIQPSPKDMEINIA